MGIQTAQYTPPPSFLQKYAFLKFPIFQNQENSRKTSRKGPYTFLWSLKGPSTTLVDMQTAQDTSVSVFFVTDVRHAFVSVHILLEWEISEKRILSLFSELEYSLEHSGGYPYSLEHSGRYAFSPEDVRQCSAGHGHPRQEPPTHPSPHLFGQYSDCWDNRLK